MNLLLYVAIHSPAASPSCRFNTLTVQSPMQVVQLRRQSSGVDREKTHLLCLYGALCSCINSREHRVRELVQSVLQLAGAELGLSGVSASLV